MDFRFMTIYIGTDLVKKVNVKILIVSYQNI